MGNTLMEISVPLDKENFIELECDFCKNRFMLHQDVYESDDNINFFCPICGLPNKISIGRQKGRGKENSGRSFGKSTADGDELYA